DCRRPIERGARSPLGPLDVDMGRNHRFSPSKRCPAGVPGPEEQRSVRSPRREMRRAARLCDIIQILRTASHPITAAALAEKLEVTVRTIYRDIAALQGSRVPIE